MTKYRVCSECRGAGKVEEQGGPIRCWKCNGESSVPFKPMLTKRVVHELAMRKYGEVVVFRLPGQLWQLMMVKGDVVATGKTLRELCKNSKLRIPT